MSQSMDMGWTPGGQQLATAATDLFGCTGEIITSLRLNELPLEVMDGLMEELKELMNASTDRWD